MTESLPMMVVGLANDSELLDAMRRYKGLRTYPHAHDASQRRLHEACAQLQERGLVQGREKGNVWEWSAL